MIEVCFVCTEDTCRSVMAERIARKMAKDRNINDIVFSSAGLFANGANITDNARLALERLGYESQDQKSVFLDKIDPKVLYVAVTNEHKRHINSKNCICFDQLAGRVEDPYGKGLDVYLNVAKQIEKNVDILLYKIKKLRGEK